MMKTMMRTLVKFCLVLACITLGLAQADIRALAQESGAGNPWTRMPGTAVDISINAEGQAYVTAPDGTPWRWDKAEQRWRRMSGKFVRITAAEGNRPWAVNADGVVFRYNGLWWEDKDTDAADVAADTQGNVYIAKTDGSIKKWYPLRSEWRPFEGVAKRIALDPAGHPWAVTRDGRIRAFDGNTWTILPGLARDLAMGGTDIVTIVDMDGRLRTWNGAQKRWAIVDGISAVSAVAVTPEGKMWAVVQGGAILSNGGLVSAEKLDEDIATDPKAGVPQAPVITALVKVAKVPTPPTATVTAPTVTTPAAEQGAVAELTGSSTTTTDAGDPATLTTKDKITFVNTRKTASTLAIGKDGSVFGLDGGGNVLRWSNARKIFDSFPGTLARIAVDGDGNPWGISALGRVFRHTGKLWKQIANATASDIAIGFDGTVLVTNAAGRLFKLNAAQTRFEMIPGQGVLVAVAPDGTPWTVRADNLVQRCDTSPCKVIAQKAQSIAVGPDGSVFIVSDQNRLMRLKADGKSFDVILTPGHTPKKVAVGPNGYPWVVSSAKLALAANFFERDEQNDRTVAASTGGDTTGSGSTAAVVDVPSATSFTFSKNMSFQTYASGMNSLSSIHAGENGKVYARGTNTVGQSNVQKIRVFNDTKKTFEDSNLSFPEAVSAMDAASDGTVWGYKNGSVYKLSATGKLLKTYTVSSGTANDLVIGADDTVYIVNGSSLYRLKPGTSVFMKFSNDDVSKVAVGRAGDLWIMDSSNIVQQYTGTRFENRPLGQSVTGTDIGAGSDGSVYISMWTGSAAALKKWNATNKSFDTVNNVEADVVDVDSDGRPWIAYTSSNNDVKRGKD